MSELLKITDLHVEYDTSEETVYAVNGVDLTVGRKETLGLVGETGAGKTTTALSVLRLLPHKIGRISKGSIIYDGEDLLAIKEKVFKKYRGKRISMIFQDPMTSLNPVIPIGKQVAEVIKLHNPDMTKAQIESRVDEMLEMVGIKANRKKDYPNQFSGGMKQRVVIAIALACEPELLIADEPTTALDVTVQAQVLAMMTDLKERLGTSMILITHDLGVVAETCDKVAVMYAGEIVESGTVEDIFGKGNHHPYTIGLFGSLPDLKDDKPRLSPIEGLMPDPTDLPKGCKFHPRCPHCSEKCRTEQPEVMVTNGHSLRCHLFSKEV
ncbi:MAG: ABC transporter ATP-binding protein [Lachnospiraceae bacterium]|nr:ABC transporter ATP-binding protein [Lachnospiraceae bacterium]